jgi:hypothetical protein
VYTHTFTIPGIYEYRCDPHVTLGMIGTVTVLPANVPNVVITEIMYNPPEAGNDTLEFIELFNAGDSDADLTGWIISEGVVDTFGNLTLAAGEYLILAKSASAFINTFNYTGAVEEWTSGSLGNGGEDIEIRDANGTVVDLVDYDDALPWPLGADGEGSSIVLCDVESDNNLGSSWQAAMTPTGIIINDLEILANPGGVSDCGDLEPSIFWNATSAFVNENVGTLTFSINFANFVDGDLSVELALEGSSTASLTADFTTSPSPLPQTFMAPGVVTGSTDVTVTIIDDGNIEADETIVLSITANTGMIVGGSELTITIFDNDSEVVVTPIGDINGVNADGVALFNDSTRTVQGMVHCTDFDGNAGYNFFLIEPGTGDGLTVFSGGDVDDYVVQEGDELQVTGDLTQFRGLLEIVPQMITLVSENNTLASPEGVEQLGEDTENRYVEYYTNSPDQPEITVFGSGSINATYEDQNGDTITVRFDEVLNVDSAQVVGLFDGLLGGLGITGYGSQFSSGFDAPFNDGYQILVCSPDDIQIVFSVGEPGWASEVKLFPNPVSHQLTIDRPLITERFRVLDNFGRLVRKGIVGSQRIQVDLSNHPAGIYFVQLFDGADVVTRRVIKQ